MSDFGRREFLFSAGITGAGLLAFYGLARRYGFSSTPWGVSSESNSAGFGPLVATKTNNTGETFLALPKDFQYTVFGETGSRMLDGNPTPRAHDGMAAFLVNDELRLVRNHEVDIKIGAPGAAIGPDPFDPLAAGVTTLVIDPKTRKLVRDFVSLSGTLLNCAEATRGIVISCEETVLGPAKIKNSDGVEEGGFKAAMATVLKSRRLPTKLSRRYRSKQWVASCTKQLQLTRRRELSTSPRICRRPDSTGSFLQRKVN